MQAQFTQVGSILALLLAAANAGAVYAETVTLHTRGRVPSAADTNEWQAVEKTVEWVASRSAIVICDMWDKHWCPDATERVGEMAPRMNEVVKAARAKGVFIIHCPSDT